MEHGGVLGGLLYAAVFVGLAYAFAPDTLPFATLLIFLGALLVGFWTSLAARSSGGEVRPAQRTVGAMYTCRMPMWFDRESAWLAFGVLFWVHAGGFCWSRSFAGAGSRDGKLRALFWA